VSIEIYVLDCPREQLLSWIEMSLGPLGEPEDGGRAIVYPSGVGPVILTPGIDDGPFTGVWFNTTDRPWATDVDCGRQAARALGCTVRCDPGDQFPEGHWAADTFLEIRDGEERLITLD
jgi:hypothetical protein